MDQFVFVIKLLQTMTYFRCLQSARKLPMTANIRSEFSECQWYQWQPMAANGTTGKITIGKTPNVSTVRSKIILFSAKDHTFYHL